jgi:endonuclease-8
MPEGDTIFRAARTLNLALAGKTITTFETVLPRLGRVHEDAPITGRTVTSVTSHGKWMMMRFSGDLILLTHMLMSGSWHIYRPGEKWQRPRIQMRIMIGTQEILAVAFSVPVAEFHTEESLKRHPGLSRLGQDVLASGFDVEQALDALRSRPDLEVAEALLSQSLMAGAGNVYKSEICFACAVHPFRKVSSLSEAELRCLVETARKFLSANVTESAGDGITTYTGLRRTTRRASPGDRLWVYGRAGEPCRKCGASIERKKQGRDARSTFYCPKCQTPA